MRFGDPGECGGAVLLIGMAAAPVLITVTTGFMPPVDVPLSDAAIILGELILGLVVSYRGGCTSGHGVCGNGRLSRRSIVATLSFMAAAFVIAFVIRHLIGAS
jgi:uncharacterized membrane protein YedE/YeeE